MQAPGLPAEKRCESNGPSLIHALAATCSGMSNVLAKIPALPSNLLLQVAHRSCEGTPACADSAAIRSALVPDCFSAGMTSRSTVCSGRNLRRHTSQLPLTLPALPLRSRLLPNFGTPPPPVVSRLSSSAWLFLVLRGPTQSDEAEDHLVPMAQRGSAKGRNRLRRDQRANCHTTTLP